MDSCEEEEYYYYSDEEEYSGDGLGKSGTDEPSLDAAEGKRGAGNSVGSSAEPGAAVAKPNRATGQEYTVLSEEMLEAEQDKLVNNVAEVLDINYDTANVLLLHFRWNKEKLFDAYYADPAGTCESAGAPTLASAAPMEADVAAGAASKEDDEFLCEILFVEVPFKYTFAMPCGHRYSADAWQSYLRSKVDDGKDCIFAMCPSDECKATVSPKAWEKVLTMPVEDPDEATAEANKLALQKYKRFLAASFVDINRTMRHCPGRNCKVAIKSSGAVASVKCTECGSLFCFKCGQEAHAPTSCRWLSEWQEKCSNESETANWILANTKKCPKCSTRIEKNQGCNHMQCKVCKADFCWICMGSWANHGTGTGGYYNCNRYKSAEEPGEGQSDDKVSKAKRELDRYLHYYKRFAAHESAGKYATEQRERAERRMVEMQTASSLGWVDVQFLTQAVEQLIACRRVLKNTYIHAYYLPGGPKKELFEYLQSLLESHTEKLSELSEMPLDKTDRSEVINFTRVTGKFMDSLLEQVDSEGIGMDDSSLVAAAAQRAPGSSS